MSVDGADIDARDGEEFFIPIPSASSGQALTFPLDGGMDFVLRQTGLQGLRMVGFLRLVASGLGRIGVLWASAASASCTSGSDMPRGAGMLE